MLRAWGLDLQLYGVIMFLVLLILRPDDQLSFACEQAKRTLSVTKMWVAIGRYFSQQNPSFLCVSLFVPFRHNKNHIAYESVINW